MAPASAPSRETPIVRDSPNHPDEWWSIPEAAEYLADTSLDETWGPADAIADALRRGESIYLGRELWTYDLCDTCEGSRDEHRPGCAASHDDFGEYDGGAPEPTMPEGEARAVWGNR